MITHSRLVACASEVTAASASKSPSAARATLPAMNVAPDDTAIATSSRFSRDGRFRNVSGKWSADESLVAAFVRERVIMGPPRGMVVGRGTARRH
ncbi:unannotated protein [freshwater metagenome]|uniref:Unannotated protein n=1 Tax=freshwater metagenome TaxID=449393 RepID=A0A6J6GF81_9ZZZZ